MWYFIFRAAVLVFWILPSQFPVLFPLFAASTIALQPSFYFNSFKIWVKMYNVKTFRQPKASGKHVIMYWAICCSNRFPFLCIRATIHVLQIMPAPLWSVSLSECLSAGVFASKTVLYSAADDLTNLFTFLYCYPRCTALFLDQFLIFVALYSANNDYNQIPILFKIHQLKPFKNIF